MKVLQHIKDPKTNKAIKHLQTSFCVPIDLRRNKIEHTNLHFSDMFYIDVHVRKRKCVDTEMEKYIYM